MNLVRCYLVCIIMLPSILAGQQSLSLSEAIRIASDSSLSAFKAKNLYMAGYWEYRAYIANKRPILQLNSTMVDYNRMLTKRYNSVLDIDEYREQQNIYSYINASLSQNLPFTGGTIYLDSEIDRLQNIGDNNYTQYSNVPLRIGIVQPLLGYNAFKWKRKTEPLKYVKAQKTYLQSTENLSLVVSGIFFDLLTAQIKVKIARTNRANADTLYAIALKRLEIATLSQNDVLTLKVQALSAKNELATALKVLNSARFAFLSFLRLPEESDIALITPDSLPRFKVNPDKALAEALKNSPALLEFKQQELESASAVERTRREGLMNASLNASYGLNKQGANFKGTYNDPLDQQRASIGLSIPIIDWGQRRGLYNMAKSNYEAVRLTAEQAEIDFRQSVLLAVSDFNLQLDVVETARESRKAAREAYSITKQRFLIGKLDVNSLSLALERQNLTDSNYIEALRIYWQYFYRIRQLTLYDFETDKSLMEDFEQKLPVR